MEPSSSGLMKLPLENLERIIEFLRRQGLLDPCSTWRRLEHATFTIFKQSYFDEPAYLLADEDSLTVLQEISQHPVLGRTVRRIYLSLSNIPKTLEDFNDLIGSTEFVEANRSFANCSSNSIRLMLQENISVLVS